MTSAVAPIASGFSRELRHTVGCLGSSRGVHFRRGRHPSRCPSASASTSNWEVDETGGVVFTVTELVAATGGELIHQGSPGSVSTDTRMVRPGQWFLALSGEQFDGEEFVGDALAGGCAGVISCRPCPENWTAGYVQVDNTTQSLQDLASNVRDRFKGPMVGITGSVGKTTVRDLIALALGETETHKTSGNLNNHIGLPLTILRTPPNAKVCVLEMGMSVPGEIGTLVAIARPSIRVVINVAPAHLAGVGDIDGVARAKAEMFHCAVAGDVCVVNKDDTRVMAMCIPNQCSTVSFGRIGSGADVEYDVDLESDDDGDTVFAPATFTLQNKHETTHVSLCEPGAHLAACAACAAAVAVATGVPLETAGTRMSAFTSPKGRMRVCRSSASGITVLDDAYNASPKSVANALLTLRNARDRGHRTVALLGDMLELGEASHGLHIDAVTLCLDAGFGVVGVAGDAFTSAATQLAATRPDALDIVVADDVDALWENVRDVASKEGSVVLVKGSRGMGMERIVERLIEG